MACPHAENCALYPQFALDSLLKYWKTSYCTAEHTRCARYQLSKEGKPVPALLLPSGRMMNKGLEKDPGDASCG
jgi:hypothetical protein